MSTSPRSRRLAVAGAWLAASLSAVAAAQTSPSEREVRTWAAACAACHNTDGRSVGGMPALAGRPGDDLYRALIEFRTGKRPATVMHQHARGYTEDELRAIADWFSAVKTAR